MRQGRTILSVLGCTSKSEEAQKVTHGNALGSSSVYFHICTSLTKDTYFLADISGSTPTEMGAPTVVDVEVLITWIVTEHFLLGIPV